jgi:hypothetical protein
MLHTTVESHPCAKKKNAQEWVTRQVGPPCSLHLRDYCTVRVMVPVAVVLPEVPVTVTV